MGDLGSCLASDPQAAGQGQVEKKKKKKRWSPRTEEGIVSAGTFSYPMQRSTEEKRLKLESGLLALLPGF